MLIDGPAAPRARYLFAHGAGAPMDTPFMNAIAEGLSANKIQVIRFEFAYMAKRRDDGKRRGPDRMPVLLEAWRTALDGLSSLDVPTLIVQGERDRFGTPEDVISYALKPPVEVVWIPDGDHSFVPRKSSGLTERENIDTAVHHVTAFIERMI